MHLMWTQTVALLTYKAFCVYTNQDPHRQIKTGIIRSCVQNRSSLETCRNSRVLERGIGTILSPLAGKFSEDTRTKGKGAKTGASHDWRSFYLSQYDWLKGSHMTKVVWLPNETDYSYCEFVAPNTPYYCKTFRHWTQLWTGHMSSFCTYLRVSAKIQRFILYGPTAAFIRRTGQNVAVGPHKTKSRNKCDNTIFIYKLLLLHFYNTLRDIKSNFTQENPILARRCTQCFSFSYP